jgi:hypothetical protein
VTNIDDDFLKDLFAQLGFLERAVPAAPPDMLLNAVDAALIIARVAVKGIRKAKAVPFRRDELERLAALQCKMARRAIAGALAGRSENFTDLRPADGFDRQFFDDLERMLEGPPKRKSDRGPGPAASDVVKF